MVNIDNPVALGHLAEARKHHGREIVIQTEMKDMFKALGMGPVLARPVGRREADIHVTDYNCIVETKATGKANPEARGSRGETQKAQLCSYVDGLRENLRGEFDFDGILYKPWVGILTDGQSGWIWRWENEGSMSPEELGHLRWNSQETNENVLKNTCTALGKTPAGQKWAPDEIYEMFRGDEEEFYSLYRKLTRDPSQEIRTKFELWLERLQGSGMAPDHELHQHDLFVKHCFLVAVAKAVIGALTPETDDDDPKVVLGEGFTAWLVENDEGVEKSNALFEKARGYNWRFRFGDVLRSLYEQCIEKANRKIYGEYYTPDWIAEQMAEEILDNEWIETAANAALKSLKGDSEALTGIGILDPACGSGTFLYHAARRISRASVLSTVLPEERALAVASLVHGIDIHPVAVEMAKATLLRALPPLPREKTGQDFSALLNITQGDSLLATEVQEGLLTTEFVEFISPKGTEFRMPQKAIRNPRFRNFLPKLVEAACEEHGSIPDEVPEELRDPLRPFLNSLKKIIRDEGDSVWTWYILNRLGPSCLAERKVNRILANPPWVRASNIQVEVRKKEVESMARKLELWVGGKNATGFDIAALFIHRCRNLYLDKKTGKAAWITNNAAIKGGNWENFRQKHWEFLTKVIDYGKLREQPFKGAKSCALIQGEPAPIKDKSEAVEDKLPITEIEKTKVFQLLNADKRINRNQQWEEIRDATYMEEQSPEKLIPKAESKYVGRFRQGATIVPHCLLVIEKADKQKNGQVGINTRKSRHLPWKNIESLKGTVPKRWVVSCIFSDDLLPFTIRPKKTRAVIPIGEEGVLEEHPEKNPYWLKADKLYQQNKGKGQRTPQTLLNQIDFSSKLRKQLPIIQGETDLCQVIYNEAGQHLRAARCSNSKVIVEHACYWYRASCEGEAKYIVSFLNAQCLQDAYRECRKSDRHFDTHIWNGVPVPYYDPGNSLHKKLAMLCIEAENFVARLVPKLNLDYKQERLSQEIKTELKKSRISGQIDEIVREILPKQVR